MALREIGLGYTEVEPDTMTAHVRNPLAEARYYRDYVWPWVARRLTGRSSGDSITAKFDEWIVFEPARS